MVSNMAQEDDPSSGKIIRALCAIIIVLCSAWLIKEFSGSFRELRLNKPELESIETKVEASPEHVKPVQEALKPEVKVEPPAPVPVPTPPPEPPKPVAPAPKPVTPASGSCEAEIYKYDWNHSVALAVARAESGLNPGALNNNPRTKDYSVGCFQINLYGANARTRPSEATLKVASENVAFAYRIYKSNGSSFVGQWGVCRAKVNCY